MAKTETKKNLFQKLLEIQRHIMGLGKDKAAFGYKYVTGDKVLEHLKPLMNEHGVLLKQEVLSIENVRQDYQTANGKAANEINSKVMMKFTWVDCDTGEKDENLFGANGQNAWDKGVGSALTYGERYFLLKYFHIATDEDDIDNPQRKPQEAPQETQEAKATQGKGEQPNAAQAEDIGTLRDRMRALIKRPEINGEEKKKFLLTINGLPPERIRKGITHLEGLIAERGGVPA
jgi:hypothetical protein